MGPSTVLGVLHDFILTKPPQSRYSKELHFIHEKMEAQRGAETRFKVIQQASGSTRIHTEVVWSQSPTSGGPIPQTPSSVPTWKSRLDSCDKMLREPGTFPRDRLLMTEQLIFRVTKTLNIVRIIS